jgi:hypothetical protein
MGLTLAKAQSSPSSEGRENYLEEFIHRYFPTFAAFASLREIFRVSVGLCRASSFVMNIFFAKY